MRRDDMGLKPDKRVVVLGVGNILFRDEGIGVHVIEMLGEIAAPEGVQLEVVDGGTSPDVCLDFQGVDKLIAVDAARGGGEPGAIYRFRPDDLECEAGGIISTHQAGLLQSLKLLEYLGREPREVVIFGVEPRDISSGLELSDDVKRKIPEIVELIQAEIKKVSVSD